VTGPRPTVLVLVAGTGTDVGKTWVSARLLEAWRAAGLSVAARKPAQSFTAGSGPTDADVLGQASAEEPDLVCPRTRWYPVALAPPMAAAALGLAPPTLAGLVDELVWPRTTADIGLVETAGGVRSPQTTDADVIDVVSVVAPDRILLVADAGLGTINAVRLTMAALAGIGRGETGEEKPRRNTEPIVVLNRYDPSSDLHRRNLAWLRNVDALDVREITPETLRVLAHELAVPGD
jgi:dethiobiotin synthetase